jgi:hypothetical protein
VQYDIKNNINNTILITRLRTKNKNNENNKIIGTNATRSTTTTRSIIVWGK